VGATTEKYGSGGTPVTDAVTFTDGTGALYREPTLLFSTTAPGNATRVNALANATGPAANISGTDANPLPNESDGSTGPWAPLVIGQFPLAFSSGTTSYYTGAGLIGLEASNGDNRVYFTYRLQYADPITTGNWVTYDTKYGRTTDGVFEFQSNFNQTSPGFSPCVTEGPNEGFNTYSWASAMDPRSARFGLIMDTLNPQRSNPDGGAAISPAAKGWIFNLGNGATNGAMTVGITYPTRQDNSGGFFFLNLDSTNGVPPGSPNSDQGQGLLSLATSIDAPTTDIPYPSFSAGWTSALMPVNEGHGESDVWMFAPGLYAQNNPSVPFYGVTYLTRRCLRPGEMYERFGRWDCMGGVEAPPR
jgi:hypothetical protein